MDRALRGIVSAIALLTVLCVAHSGFAQKRGGILKMYDFDSPPTMSILEEATASSQSPMMGVFNNLLLFDQHQKQNRLDTIVPDLATDWSWNEDGTALTLHLRQGVKWHDGQPFTAMDVVCTWDLQMDTGKEKLRFNPRKSLYKDLDHVSTNGDYEVTFHLKRPQPGFPGLLAGGFSPIYPCHVPAAQMRQHPIGTGPFKFVEFKQNEAIRVTRNPDYWKAGLPYLDGIDYTIIKDPSTAVLSFIAGKVDMTFPYLLRIPQLKDVQNQVPQANCEITPGGGVNAHVLINRDSPPFDNLELRKAMALSIDRRAFIDIISQGQGDIGGVLQPPPGGQWGMPPDMLKTLPGYDPDIEKNRTEARQIMQKLGYGPDNPLKIKVATRDIPLYRDPAVLLVDQLKQVYFDGELELIDTSRYFPKIMRKEFTVSLNLQTSSPEAVELFYACGASLNWDGYCNKQVDELFQQQSEAGDEDRRKQILWRIERKLAEDYARPIIFYGRVATCWQPYVKNMTLMVNSVFSGNRREDIWLDK
ncbi:MAG: ABC transporter substrate-binding protein [Alphaproteobacteria bacterium]|nr:ABC transporter substrate-binding protein [Alphaproteobacteria bacterium]